MTVPKAPMVQVLALDSHGKLISPSRTMNVS
jgi:hypothetical protein